MSPLNLSLLKTREDWTKSEKNFAASLLTPSLQVLLRGLDPGEVTSMGRRMVAHGQGSPSTQQVAWENIFHGKTETGEHFGLIC